MWTKIVKISTSELGTEEEGKSWRFRGRKKLQRNLPIDETIDLDISEEESENNVDVDFDVDISTFSTEELELRLEVLRSAKGGIGRKYWESSSTHSRPLVCWSSGLSWRTHSNSDTRCLVALTIADGDEVYLLSRTLGWTFCQELDDPEYKPKYLFCVTTTLIFNWKGHKFVDNGHQK